MYFIKNRSQKPLWKKILPLKQNVQNNNKVLKFKKLKWQKFQRLISKKKKKLFYDSASYPLSNFKNFFSKKFKYNLQNKQRLSIYYGNLRKSYLKKTLRLILKSSKKFKTRASILYIQKLEIRLDTVLYRTHFCHSLHNAGQLISHKKIYVNNKIVPHKFFELKKGDLITFDKSINPIIKSNILNSELWPTPPRHFHINYKILQILITENIRYISYYNYYHFWIDLNSFIRHYIR